MYEEHDYSKTQQKWNDYYADKQWIDTKGWCDLNGNPISFRQLDNECIMLNTESLLKLIFKALLKCGLTFLLLLILPNGLIGIGLIIWFIYCIKTIIKLAIKIYRYSQEDKLRL